MTSNLEVWGEEVRVWSKALPRCRISSFAHLGMTYAGAVALTRFLRLVAGPTGRVRCSHSSPASASLGVAGRGITRARVTTEPDPAESDAEPG